MIQLVVIRGPRVGARFTLKQGRNTVGRSSASDIQLPSSHVSQRHCVFILDGDAVTLQDRNSTNGVVLEGRRVQQCSMADGDRVQLGDWLLKMEVRESRVATSPGAHSSPATAGQGTQDSPQPFGPSGAPGPAAASGNLSADAAGTGGATGDAPGFGMGHPPGGFGDELGPSSQAPGGPVPTVERPPGSRAEKHGTQLRGVDEIPHGDPAVEPISFNSPELESPPAGTPAGSTASQEETAIQVETGDLPGGHGPAGRAQEDRCSEFRDFPRPVAPPSDYAGSAASAGFGMPSAAGLETDPASVASPAFAAAAEPGAETTSDLTTEYSHGGSRSIFAQVRSFWKRIRGLPWKIQLAGLMALAALVVLFAPAGGVLAGYWHVREVALEQTLSRARALGLALGARNITAVAKQNNLALDATFILKERGVQLALITDSRGIVRAPPEKVRQSIATKDFFKEANQLGQTVTWNGGGGEWHVLSPIKVSPVEGAPASLEGWAYILYDTGVVLDESVPSGTWLLASVMVTFLAFGATGVLAWQMASRPVKELRDELELALHGHLSRVSTVVDWKELRDLAHSVDRVLGRWSRAGAGGRDRSTAPDAGIEAIGVMVRGLSVPVFLVEGCDKLLEISDGALSWLGLNRDQALARGLATLLPDEAFLDSLRAACADSPVATAGEGLDPLVREVGLGVNRARICVVARQERARISLVSVG